ncbi:hexose transporter hxt1 [Aspergillus pseudoviridinutans]|uniref:Hexose transporter hxt1 n=1 Tax=Aspergillus pseudoviridinutans TaxID=1517512 RepID=A0A9P3BPL1_9EURO|nr:hexose transporter hxt1 [Aspergillus pseudoviridinutans]GIJ91574.1 hexose transporter hxt1 [Aspergillus pseudoviridinutans]
MFQGPHMTYRIFLGIVLQALQQLTGASCFFYRTVVFNGAGIKNTYVTQLILGVVNFGTTFGGLYVIEHFQRRKSLITGGIWIFVCFMVFVSVGHFSLNVHDPPQTPGAGKAMVLLSSIHCGIPRGPRLQTGFEDFLIGFSTPFITDDVEFAYGYVFAGCLFAGVLVVYFCVLEGKGKTPGKDKMYVMRVPAWKKQQISTFTPGAPYYHGASSEPEDNSGD